VICSCLPSYTQRSVAGARHPSGKGEVCKNPFDSIVLTALSSVFSSRIAARNAGFFAQILLKFQMLAAPHIRLPAADSVPRAAPLVFLAGTRRADRSTRGREHQGLTIDAILLLHRQGDGKVSGIQIRPRGGAWRGWAWLAGQDVVGLGEAGFLSSPSTSRQAINSTRTDVSIMSQGHLRVPLLSTPANLQYYGAASSSASSSTNQHRIP
jgi:hypothetical protein